METGQQFDLDMNAYDSGVGWTRHFDTIASAGSQMGDKARTALLGVTFAVVAAACTGSPEDGQDGA